MDSITKFFQSGDWKGEKHVPVIHVPDEVKVGEAFELGVSIGDAVAHPNTLEHHISWFKVFYFEDDGKFPVELATFDFTSHGESGAFNEPVGKTLVKLNKCGTIYAVSYCNIHGLWESSEKITVKE
ncbi:MAG TPA: class II SORL domain-containing protein [Bacillota bacterium]|nr:class II SORL domain-containing protein [Bacillota bacterium]